MDEWTSRLADPLYRNWVRGALGLKYLKNGICGPVDRLVQHHHETLLQSYVTDKGKPAVNCTECTLENLLPEHQRNNCIHKFRSKCLCSKPSGRRKCPNDFCSHFYDLIVLAHDDRNPSFLNTDPSRWYSDHWSFAQCFVASSGYADKKSSLETDAAGLLTIIISNIDIRGRTDNVDNFIQARQDRNDIMHSTNFEVQDSQLVLYIDGMIKVLQDAQLVLYIDGMIKVLQDATLLLNEQEAIRAVQDLETLKENKLTVTTQDITDVLEDVIAQNTRRAREEIEERKQEIIKTSIERLEYMKSSISGIENKMISSAKKLKIDVVEEIKDAALNVQQNYQQIMDGQTTRQEYHIKAVATREKDSMVANAKHQIDKHSLIHEQRLAERTKEYKEEICALSASTYAQLKKDLQADLIAFYQDRHSTLPLSPLQEEQDAPLIDFYVSPTLSIAKNVDGEQSKERVNTYSDIFTRELGHSPKIYLTSPAGRGKTAFTKRMVLTWCQSKKPTDSNRNYFSNFAEDIDAMKPFSYLFLIALRDVSKEHSDVDSMIESEILSQLAGRYSSEFMTRLLRDEITLIILDGLDEWSHPVAGYSSGKKISDIPNMRVREHCTLLTTTRPWKLDVLRLSSSQIDLELEMVPLSHDRACELSMAFTKHLNRRYNENRDHAEFESLVNKKPMDNIHHIPLILMQLLCLWYDRRPIGKSSCEIYANMIEFLVTRALQKSSKMVKTVTQNGALPTCFKNAANCRKYQNFLISIGKLAFEQLFSQDRSSSIVFDTSVAQNIISEDTLIFALETGILTKNKVNVQELTSRRSSLSFIHKTYQEFFAALYISMGHVAPSQIITSETSVPSLLDMWKIFVFLCGLNTVKVNELSVAIHNAISSDECTQQHRRNCDRYSSYKLTMRRLQDMMIDCIEENKKCEGEAALLPLTDVFISGYRWDSEIKEYASLLKHLMKINLRSVKSVQLSCNMHMLDSFRDELGAVQNLQSIFCTSIYLVPIFPMMVRKSYQTLNTLDIVKCSITEGVLSAVASLENLEVFSLEYSTMAIKEISKLYENISIRTGLRHLRLVETERWHDSDDKTPYPCLNLKKLAKLEILHLEDSKIRKVTFPSNLSCLKMLKCDDRVGNENISIFSEAMNVAELDIHTYSDWDGGRLPHLINKFQNLQILRLKYFHLGLLLLPSNIKYVELSGIKISAYGFYVLITRRINTRQNIEVKMVACRITPMDEYKQHIDTFRKMSTCVIIKEDITAATNNIFLHFKCKF